MDELHRLVSIMDRLRSPGGCPWDAEQTHASLAPYAIEETYELIEAIETGDRAHLREELGDVLLQVVFHARIAEDDPDAPFDVQDVARGISDKLIARHPHVFEGLQVADEAELERNWERIKAAEKGREGVMDGLPAHLPALVMAEKVYHRARRAGLADHLVPPRVDQAGEPAGPVDPAGTAAPAGAADDEAALGAALLRLAFAGAAAGLDPERAVRSALRDARARVEAADTRG